MDLVYSERGGKFKSWNLHFKFFGSGQVYHLVISMHGTNGGCQQTARTIGVGFSRLYNWFSANYTFAINGFNVFERIVDIPMPSRKLNNVLAQVFNGNGIAKGVMHFIIFEECTFKGSLHRYFYPFCDLSEHRLIGKNTSCKQHDYRKYCQKGKYSVQKEIFDNGFKCSLPIELFHGQKQVYTENCDKYTCT